MRHKLDIIPTTGGGHMWRLLDPFGQPIAESSTVAKDETTARANFEAATFAAHEIVRLGRESALAPTAAILARLASIVGHVQEAITPDIPAASLASLESALALHALLSDPALIRWTEGMRALSLMPAKRTESAQGADPQTAPAGA